MRQNSKESMGTQQPVLKTVLMMGEWIVNVIPGIAYGIKANCGEWAAYPTIGQWFLPRSTLIAIWLVTLVTTIRCSSRNASDTIIRLL